MARSFLLQDWVCLYGPGREFLCQTEPFWLDLGGYTDLVFYTSIQHIAGDAEIYLESGPSKNEALFALLAQESTIGPRSVKRVPFATATLPHTRWVRWRASGADDWEITFRIWVTAIATGRHS